MPRARSTRQGPLRGGRGAGLRPEATARHDPLGLVRVRRTGVPDGHDNLERAVRSAPRHHEPADPGEGRMTRVPRTVGAHAEAFEISEVRPSCQHVKPTRSWRGPRRRWAGYRRARARSRGPAVRCGGGRLLTIRSSRRELPPGTRGVCRTHLVEGGQARYASPSASGAIPPDLGPTSAHQRPGDEGVQQPSCLASDWAATIALSAYSQSASLGSGRPAAAALPSSHVHRISRDPSRGKVNLATHTGLFVLQPEQTHWCAAGAAAAGLDQPQWSAPGGA
jgi:hypothetical protein